MSNVISHILASANSASSSSRWREVGVLPVKWVAVNTVGLASVASGCPNASQGIDPMRNCFEVVRPDAVSNATEMVDLEPFRNRANTELVGPPMGADGLAAYPNKPISEISRRCPEPARISELDLRPEANRGGAAGVYSNWHRKLLSVSMRQAEPISAAALTIAKREAKRG